MTQGEPKGVDRCCQKPLLPSLGIYRRLCNTPAVLDVYSCSTASHSLCWEGTWNLVFLIQFGSQPRQELHGVNYDSAIDPLKSHTIFFMHPRMVIKHTQAAMDVSHCSTFHFHSERISTPKSGILYAIWESTLVEMTQYEPRKEALDSIKSLSNIPPTSEEDYEILQQQWLSLFATQHPISCATRLPEMGY